MQSVHARCPTWLVRTTLRTSAMATAPKRPRVLISNDDGIKAPGLVSLVAALHKAGFCSISVCAPSGERSASSHAITLGRHMSCYPVEGMEGVDQAFAVNGTPADSVMLALHGPVFKEPMWDLVVSGINRGDNCGLHVIYSGTVGAAREAVCKGLSAVAFSLTSHQPRQVEDYESATAVAVPLIKGMLGLCPDAPGSMQGQGLVGSVVNVNIPYCPSSDMHGYYLTHQGLGCVFPSFKELHEDPGPHLPEIDEHTPNLRIFRNYSGHAARDDTEGSDMWAVEHKWVSVTPLGLRQDLVRHMVDEEVTARAKMRTLVAVLKGAAADINKKMMLQEKLEARL